MRGCWGNGEYICVAIPNGDVRGELGWVGVGGKRGEREGERKFSGFQFCYTQST
jgi:hypothetical protein